MVVVSEPQADVKEQIDPPSAVRERAEAFTAEVLAEAMGHPVQMANGGLYVRGLIEQGGRKCLQPMVVSAGGEADYESMQQFLADCRGIRRWWCGGAPSGSRRRSTWRRGCWMTRGSRRTGSARRG